MKTYGKDVLVAGFKTNKMKEFHLGQNVRLGEHVRIQSDGIVTIEDDVTIHHHTTILGSGDLHIGRGTWIGQYSALDCEAGLEIGTECCIGFNCQIWSHVQRAPYLPTIPDFRRFERTILGDRVWLMGGMISVSPGAIISNDSIILTNSVVTGVVPENQVWGGVPAKRIPYWVGRDLRGSECSNQK